MSAAVKRAIIRACIATGIAELVIQAAGVRVIHHGAIATALGVIVPVVTILSGLYYLRSTKGKS